MKREDFKEITEEHIETCKKIINSTEYTCFNCPFYFANSTNLMDCVNNGYKKSCFYRCRNDELVLKSAKEFLKLFGTPRYTTSNPIINEKLKNGDKQVEKLIEKTKDNVNSPNHYKLNISGHDIEVIDIIKAVLTPEEFRGYLKGNTIKYIMRESNKNHIEDLEKCDKHLEWLIKEDKGVEK